MIDLYNTLLEKKCARHDKLADCARSHAERTDIERGTFEGKPDVKRVIK
jgi:hypothetical protein